MLHNLVNLFVPLMKTMVNVVSSLNDCLLNNLSAKLRWFGAKTKLLVDNHFWLPPSEHITIVIFLSYVFSKVFGLHRCAF